MVDPEIVLLMVENRVVFLFVAFLVERECVAKLRRMKNVLFSTWSFLHTSNAEKPHLRSPIKTKVFIKYVSCRSWAVRFPAGTRLDFLAW